MATKRTATTRKGTKPAQAEKSGTKPKAQTKGKRGAKAQAEAPIDAASAEEVAAQVNEPASAEATPDASAAPTTEAGESKRKTRKARTPKPRDGRLSQIDAALKVLAEAGQPMSTREMVEAMGAKGYWSSPAGRTPEATLYSAILRELKNKGSEARFTKTDRGRFALKG